MAAGNATLNGETVSDTRCSNIEQQCLDSALKQLSEGILYNNYRITFSAVIMIYLRQINLNSQSLFLNHNISATFDGHT